MKRTLFFVAVASTMALLGAGCTQQATIPTPSPAEQVLTTEENQPVTNIFDPFKNKIGDSIVGLKVVSIAGVPGIQRPIAADNVLVKFSGQVTLSGTYDYSVDDFAGGEKACFTLADAKERVKLPVLIGQPDQNTGFCFSNIEKARAAFGPSYGQGQATITVDSYELWYAPAEVVNQARLLTVVSKKPVPVIK